MQTEHLNQVVKAFLAVVGLAEAFLAVAASEVVEAAAMAELN